MSACIRLEDVSLKFRIYRDPSPSLKEQALNLLRCKAPERCLEFLALQKISVKIEHGERVGIVGLNGAGKSTLLKAIVGIYPPCHGAIRVRGKVVPLIEVGTGFDLEMTGRENIYLNGALLARTKDEMRVLEQKIIDFAELEEFIDTPIKYYSSGMVGRLAFAVATMVDPEILIVDEIFSTGDAQFVDKSVKRMQQLLDKSHIVLMVSHSPQHILELCQRVLVMHKGVVVNDGPAKEMIDFYYREIVRKELLVGGRL